jgi:carbamoyl-phosphate synthase large subunit
MVINTTVGAQAIADSFGIRRTSLMHRVPHFTTVSAALAAAHAIEAARAGEKTLVARTLQDYHRIPGDGPDTAPISRAGYRGDAA